MHYVYPSTGQVVPPEIAAGVTKVPSVFGGGFWTADGVQVTAVRDDADQPFGSKLQHQQDAGSLTKVDLSGVEAQLDRIEAKLDQLLAK